MANDRNKHEQQWKRMKQPKTALQKKNMKNIENTLKESVKIMKKHWKKQWKLM